MPREPDADGTIEARYSVSCGSQGFRHRSRFAAVIAANGRASAFRAIWPESHGADAFDAAAVGRPQLFSGSSATQRCDRSFSAGEKRSFSFAVLPPQPQLQPQTASETAVAPQPALKDAVAEPAGNDDDGEIVIPDEEKVAPATTLTAAKKAPPTTVAEATAAIVNAFREKTDAKAKSQGKAKAKPKAKAKATATGGSSSENAKIEISHEKSRSQYLCRLVLEGSPSSKTFKYSSKSSEKKALSDAKAFCRSFCKKHGVPSDKFAA